MQYIKEDIENYLVKVRRCIDSDNYTFAFGDNRAKNRELFENYIITTKDMCDSIKELTSKNFVEIRNNEKVEYLNEKLYIFREDRILKNILDQNVDEEEVVIYIKLNLIDNNYLYIVSYHKADSNKPLEFYFKKE